ncbi:MAG: GNAT family N-acetyltransferase [Pseudorhodoferax sp.]
MNASITFESPRAEELAALLDAAGWGTHDAKTLSRSIAAYTATACARDANGTLVGYASVFSDGVLTTMLGELIVHPRSQRQGIGRALMLAVESKFPGAPIYVKALGSSRDFYASLGFRVASVVVTSMFKRPPFEPGPQTAAMQVKGCSDA